MAIFVPRFVRQLRDVLLTVPADGEVLTYDSADEKWKNEAGGGGGGDISDAVILDPASSARNVIQPTAGAVIAAIVKAHAAQSVDLTQWQASDGTVRVKVSKDGAVEIAPGPGFLTDPPLAGLKVIGMSGAGAPLFEAYDNDTDGFGMYLQTWTDAPALLYLYGDASNLTKSLWRLQTDDGTCDFFVGLGSPEGVRVATVGSLYFRADGAAGTTLYVKESGAGDTGWTAISAGGSGAPTTATYITQTSDAGLSAEQALSALATGLVKNTTGTGVLSIAVPGTDYPSQAAFDDHSARHENGGGDEITVAGLSGLLADAQTPLGHQAGHNEGGVDELKLDDLGIPDDNTDLNASTARHGLLPKLSNTATEYLDGTGAWSTPAGGGGGGTAWPRKYKSGAYYQTNQAPAGDSTKALTLDRVEFHAFPVGEALTIDRITCGVQPAGNAGSVLRLGIYNDTDGAPSTLLLDAGTVAADTNGYKEITISQALSAGTLYWIAVVWQGATVGSGVVRASGIGAGSEWMGATSNASDPRVAAWTQASVSGALPSPATPINTVGVTQTPSVKVRAT